MDIKIKKDNHKSRKYYSLKVCSIKTEEQLNKDCSLTDINSKERHLSTVQNINSKQKLFDFISDKKKLSLNTFFDHKGTKEFLIGKNEAMRKIELDEILELNEDNKKFSNIKKRSISKKKLSKQKSVGFTSKRSSKKSLKIESKQKIKLKKKHNSLSTKHFTHHEDAKNNTFKEKFVHLNLKEHSANDDRISKSHGHEHEHEHKNEHTHKMKKSSLIKKKIKKNNEKINIDKSINSINTVNTKLFNNEEEYNIFKNLMTKYNILI